MIFSSKIPDDGKKALLQLQQQFGWSEDQLDYLIACMKFESNLNPQAVNKASGAVGLIQFMPAICKAYGTTTELMKSRSFAQQIPYVKKHFLPYYKRTYTLSDMYMAILYPSCIGKPDDYPMFVNGKKYEQNKGLDKNKDHIVTKIEATLMVLKCYEQGLQDRGL